jgi:hypothetical protein
MDWNAVTATHMVEDEEEARAELDAQIAKIAGTCCSDPTPSEERIIDDSDGVGSDIDAGKFYCTSCGETMSDAAHAALVADSAGVRERIARARAELRGWNEAP